MVNTNFRPIIMSLLLGALFIVCMINGAVLLGVYNNANSSILEDPTINNLNNNLITNLSDYYSSANATDTSLAQSSVSVGDRGFIIDAVGGIWKTMKVIPLLIYTIFTEFIFINIFGNPTYAIIFSVFTGMVIITIVFAVYKWIYTGEGG